MNRNRILSLAALSVTLMGGVALADHGRRGGGHESHESHESVHVRGPAVRGDVHVRGPAVRESVVVRGPAIRERAVVHENVRENVYIREPGRAGVVVRGGPVWHEGVRFREYGVRPEYRYESFRPIDGYNWRRGEWIWDGDEWVWTPGWYVRINL